jgi:AcrR family transcriptional regulator
VKTDRYNTVAEAVLKLISLKGLGAVTHTNVSRASGASRPWLYAYLGKTKDSLIEIAAKHLGTIYAGLERKAIVKDPETWLDAQIEDIRDGIQTARRYPWLIPLYFRHRGTQNLLGKVIDDIEGRYLEQQIGYAVRAFGADRELARVIAASVTDYKLGHEYRASFKAPSALEEKILLERARRFLRGATQHLLGVAKPL